MSEEQAEYTVEAPRRKSRLEKIRQNVNEGRLIQEDLDHTLAIAEELEKWVRPELENSRVMYSGNSVEQARCIIGHYRSVATESLTAAQRFKEELLVLFRAFSLMANSVAGASSHGEKNARLRGLIETLEGGYETVANYDIRIQRHSWTWDTVFRSQYPTAALMRENAELKERLKRLEERKSGEENDF